MREGEKAKQDKRGQDCGRKAGGKREGKERGLGGKKRGRYNNSQGLCVGCMDGWSVFSVRQERIPT